MINEQLIRDQIVSRTDATKRIKVDKTTIETVVDDVLKYINIINTLPEFSSMLWNKPLTEIVIANEWKDLILPESVRLDPTDLKTNNLLIKGCSLVDNDVTNYVNFINAQLKFRSLFRKDLSTDTTALNLLFTNKSLFDVLPITAVKVDDKYVVRSLDDPFIPVQLKDSIGSLFREDYFNSDADQVIMDYFSKVRF